MSPSSWSTRSFCRALFDDPEARRDQLIAETWAGGVGRFEDPGLLVNLSATPAVVQRGPCLCGEHTREILLEHGYTTDAGRQARIGERRPRRAGSEVVSRVTGARATTHRKHAAAPAWRNGRRRRRTQIIEAAIASILEVGFYQSSTNEIARRADVSWGALQYHFGTREALLLAVLRELDRRFLEDITAAHVEGKTVGERITSLYAILGRFYDTPTFLVRVQIILNLQHDPETSAEVSAEVTQHAARAEASTRRLLAEAIGPDASQTELRRAVPRVARIRA